MNVQQRRRYGGFSAPIERCVPRPGGTVNVHAVARRRVRAYRAKPGTLKEHSKISGKLSNNLAAAGQALPRGQVAEGNTS